MTAMFASIGWLPAPVEPGWVVYGYIVLAFVLAAFPVFLALSSIRMSDIRVPWLIVGLLAGIALLVSIFPSAVESTGNVLIVLMLVCPVAGLAIGFWLDGLE
jgi:hypothetical protein